MSWINEENFNNAPIRVRKYLLHSTSNTQKTHIFGVSIKMQNELQHCFLLIIVKTSGEIKISSDFYFHLKENYL